MDWSIFSWTLLTLLVVLMLFSCILVWYTAAKIAKGLDYNIRRVQDLYYKLDAERTVLINALREIGVSQRVIKPLEDMKSSIVSEKIGSGDTDPRRG